MVNSRQMSNIASAYKAQCSPYGHKFRGGESSNMVKIQRKTGFARMLPSRSTYGPSIINFWLYPKVGFFYAGMSKRIYSDVEGLISAFRRSLLTKRYHVFTGSGAGVNPPRVLLGRPSSHTNLWNSIRTNKHSTASRPKFPRKRSAITSNVTFFFLNYMEI